MSAANTACEESGWKLTNLSLQKLLYIAHMRFIAESAGEPLVKDNFEAWKYGPVVSRLYQRVKRFGDGSIKDVFLVDRNLQLPEHKCIRGTMLKYGTKSPGSLVDLTHRNRGAWATYFLPDSENIVIPNAAILREQMEMPL